MWFHLHASDAATSDIRCFNAVSDKFQDEVVSLSELYVACSMMKREFGKYGSSHAVAVSSYVLPLHIGSFQFSRGILLMQFQVTVCSVAGDQFRITQLYNRKRQEAPTKVWQSDIFLLTTKDDKGGYPNIKLLASWLKGESCLKSAVSRN